MTGARTMWMAVALALVSLGGIIGMLVADGALDLICFVLALLPVPVVTWQAWRHRARRNAQTGSAARS